MLRHYQVAAINGVRNHFKKGEKKVLLWLSTGGGKTVIFCEILKGVNYNGKKAIVAVRGRKLVDQASKRLLRENVPHGVMMNGHWNDRPYERIQICSIDTLISRNIFPDADVVIIDEAHMAVSPGYKLFAEKYAGKFILGVTATPFVSTSLRHIADHVVKPITTQELIDQKFLVAPIYYAPNTPNLSGVHISKGDYVQSELEEVMGEKCLVGDSVDQWKKIAGNRRSLYFCVSVKHSEQVAASFRAAGIPAVHCDANTPDKEREEIIKKLETGEIRVVCNVGIFCTGVDIPHIECIGMARPTKSYNLYIQQIGRGTRPFPGKENFLVIDHAGNVQTHGFITDEPECNLDGKIKKFLPTKTPQLCRECYAAFYGAQCQQCGYVVPKDIRVRELITVEGDLVRVDTISKEQQYFTSLERQQKMYGYKKGWMYYKMKDKFGKDVAQKYFPGYEERIALWKGRKSAY